MFGVIAATLKCMMMLIMLDYHAMLWLVSIFFFVDSISVLLNSPSFWYTIVKTFNFLVPLMSSNNCYEILTVD